MSRKYLFVCGAARSGTTALAKLLNSHEKICIGIERYKYKFMKAGPPFDFDALFESERFFSYQPEDTNVAMEIGPYAPIYRQMEARYAACEYVGDKIPGLYRRYAWLAKVAPGSTMIHIVRRPQEVANSWNGRAAKGGSWPAENDHTRAVAEWNRAIDLTSKALVSGPQGLVVVRYEAIFGESARNDLKLLEYLGLETTPAYEEAVADMRAQSEQLSDNRRIPQDVIDFVDKEADWKSYERLVERAL